MPKTILATAIRPLWTLIESYGHDPAAIFESCGIEPALLGRSNARLPTEACRAAWLRASTLIQDPAFCVKFGENWRPAMFGSLGYAWLSSTTLRRALNRMAEYCDMLEENSTVQVFETDADAVRVVMSERDKTLDVPALDDSKLSAVVRLCRLSCGENFSPAEVTFTHSPPPVTSAYFAYFRCPVHFDADSNSLLIPLSVVDAPLPGGNEIIATMIDREIVRYLADLDRSKVVERVQAAISERLPSGRVTSESVASELHISNRTLGRQLRAEGTTFREVLDRTRRTLAEAYLADDQSITQIAFSLGFSDQASFTRAYKRWTGIAPSDAKN